MLDWRLPSESLATLISSYYSYYLLSLHFPIKAIGFR
jgi:hypothetical protein